MKSDDELQLREVRTSGSQNTKHLSIVCSMKWKNKTFDAVIDTGAQISIMSSRIFKQIKNKNLVPSDTVVLAGLNGNQKLKADLYHNLEFELEGRRFQNDFYVTEISDDALIGLDFLIRQEMTVDFRTGVLTSPSVTIPFNIIRGPGHHYKTCRIQTSRTIVVPPETVVRTSVKLCGQVAPDKTFLIPAVYDKGLMLPNVVVRGAKEVVVEITNPSKSFHHFKKNYALGLAEECDIHLPEDASSMEQEQIHIRKTQSAMTTNDDKMDAKERHIPDHLKELYHKSSKHLQPKEENEFAEVLHDYADVFSKDEFDIGCFNGVKCRINTGDAEPVKENMRRTPLHFENEEEEHLDKMLQTGVIQPSESEWASCPVLIRKKDGRVRWCIDYRKLNKVTKKDSFPLPRIEQCIDTLSGNVWFSTLDMTSGYWQIKIDERDRHKTAFVTKYGLFEHVRMPFGLTNAPAIFQRVVQLLLKGMTWKQILAYLDDVIILGKSFKDHLTNIKRVLQRFRDYNMKLKPSKCAFFQTELVYLGRLVTKEGVKVNPANVEKVQSWPVPTTINHVERFLGFINYHRDHIKGYARLTKPLYQITGKRAKFHWSDEQQEAFDRLKVIMTTLPTLAYPNTSLPFVLDTDASDFCIGAELLQYDTDTKTEIVIGYGSYALTPAQQKYCTTRKELLAIVRFTRHFRHFLLGRQFVVRTDHSSLTWLMNFKNIHGMLARWLEELSQYDMIIQHRSGNKHGNADGLSRIPQEDKQCKQYVAGVPVEQLPCGGCVTCRKMHMSWDKFEREVEDVVPLSARRSFAVEAGRTSAELRELQQEDSVCKPLLKWCEDNKEPTQHELMSTCPAVKRFWRNRSQLRTVDGVLYYSFVEKHTEDEKLLLILPESLKAEVLHTSHDIPSSGHLGAKKTFQKIASRFIWFRMRFDVKLYVETCSKCNQNKKTNMKPKCALGQYHATSRLEKVHIDLLGPFPTSKLGNNYILSIIDQFTKWIEIVPVRTQTAEEVAQAVVDNFISRYGCPFEIFTDQGKCFESALFSTLCETLNITKSRTTPYHPMSNGQVERFNSVILAMIRCTIGEDKEGWDTQLPQLAMAIRSTVNRTTGFSPNRLMFGSENTLPVDIVCGAMRDQQQFETYPDYVQTLLRRLDKLHKAARDEIGTSIAVNKRDYDVKLKSVPYKVGDVVYRLNLKAKLGESNKLKEVYSGPYVVSKVFTPVVTQIQNEHKTMNLHNNNLKLCRDRKLPIPIQRLQRKILTGECNVLDRNDLHLDRLFHEKTSNTKQKPWTVSALNQKIKEQSADRKILDKVVVREPVANSGQTIDDNVNIVNSTDASVTDSISVFNVPEVTKEASVECKTDDIDCHTNIVDKRKTRGYVKKSVRFDERTTRSGRKSKAPRYLDQYE